MNKYIVRLFDMKGKSLTSYIVFAKDKTTAHLIVLNDSSIICSGFTVTKIMP